MNCSKDSIVALIQVLFEKSGKLKAILILRPKLVNAPTDFNESRLVRKVIQ
jgi:hypothetical protein